MSTSATPDTAGGSHHKSSTTHLPGRVALAWTLAGGVTAGGLLVAAVTLSGSMTSGIAPTSTSILFVLGGLAGLFHGSVLGYLARDLEAPRSKALGSLGLAVLSLAPTVPLAWVVALFVALTSAFAARGELLPMAGVVAAWLVALAVCAWAFAEGIRALGRAFRRWPERREGALIVVGILAILMLKFFLERPEIWFTDLQVRGLGAIILAVGATIWIALPVVLAVLHGLHRLVGDRWFAGQPPPPMNPIHRT